MRRVVLALAVLLGSELAGAHPLGNSTVNRAARIELGSGVLAIDYVVDNAEIPTLLAGQEADVDGDGSTTDAEWDGYARQRAESIRAGIDVRVNGGVLALTTARYHWEKIAGAADLSTLRLNSRYTAALDSNARLDLQYRDTRRPDEPGWKEVVAAVGPARTLLSADVPTTSPSADLRRFPPPGTDLPNVLGARIAASAAATTSEFASPEPATTNAPVAASSNPATGTLALWSFFRLGVHHIATGWDHLVFLLGLVVAQRTLRRLVWVITAFTVAHSVTLGLAASGVIALPGAWVEPAIALTIAYVGVANVLRIRRHGAPIAFAFGLVHGFGFAGALAASLAGTHIGGHGWLLELAAFNLGIEAFQLLLIALAVPLLHWLARRAWSAPVLHASSLATVAAGLGWFFARV